MSRVTLLVLLTSLSAFSASRHEKGPEWLSSEMPLPLAVRTAQDLAFKGTVERQYLIFNLLASGKLAWDQGDYPVAAAKWDSLLQLPGLDPEIDRIVRPFAELARKQGGAVKQAGAAEAVEAPQVPRAAEPPPQRKQPQLASVEGTVSGGGAAGPGGAVISLRRTDGPMPRIVPTKGRVIAQKNKAFAPRVLAVPVGSSVIFRNEDAINHNVFSLSAPSPHLDTGLYGQGGEKEEHFDNPGVVQLLCNIHSNMLGYVVVEDTPYFAQADAAGSFSIKGVQPGEYDVEVWHEAASHPTKAKLTLGREGAKLSLTVGGDQQPPAFPVDKAGKPRQPQLGY